MKMLLLALLALPSGDAEAQALYNRMTQKLSQAKTIQIKGMLGEAYSGWRLTLRIDRAAERLRYERFQPAGGTREGDVLLICNEGKTWRAGPRPAWEIPKAPAGLCTFAIRRFTQVGVWEFERNRGPMQVANAAEPAPDGFTLLGRETIGGRTCARIRFELVAREPVTFWIDEASALPVKVTHYVHGRCGDRILQTETYDDVSLDLEFPADRFKIPE